MNRAKAGEAALVTRRLAGSHDPVELHAKLGAPMLFHRTGGRALILVDSAIRLEASAGEAELTASSDHDGPWTILARPEPEGSGVAYVPGWTATYVPAGPGDGEGWSTPWAAVAVVLGALTGLLWPRLRTKQPREA